jgi:hypothetical protein
MLLGSFGEDGPGSSGGSDFIDPSNTPSGPIRCWVQAASHTGAGWRKLSPVALSLQIAAPTRKWWATEPSVVENRPEVQAAQAVGHSRSSSANWRISAAG